MTVPGNELLGDWNKIGPARSKHDLWLMEEQCAPTSSTTESVHTELPLPPAMHNHHIRDKETSFSSFTRYTLLLR